MDDVERSVQGIVVVVILGVGLVGNGLVAAAILSNRDMRTKTYFLLLNLAVVNIGLVACCTPFTLTSLIKGTWALSRVACCINGFMNLFWLIASILSMSTIVIYKFSTISNPFKRTRKRRHLLYAVSGVWSLAFACALGPMIGWSRFVYAEFASQCILAPPTEVSRLTFALFLIFVIYVMPTTITVALSLFMCCSVRRHAKRMRTRTIHDRDRRQTGQQRIVTTIGLLVAMYIASWTPFFVYAVLYLRDQAGRDTIRFLNASYIAAYAGSSAMPLVLCYRHSRLKKAVRALLTSLRTSCTCCRRRRTSSSSGSHPRFRMSSSAGSNISLPHRKISYVYGNHAYGDRRVKLGTVRDPNMLQCVDWLETYM